VRLRLFVLDACVFELRTGDDPAKPDEEHAPETASNHSGVFELGFVRDHTMSDLPDMPENRVSP
jgi:hypothetical protein